MVSGTDLIYGVCTVGVFYLWEGGMWKIMIMTERVRFCHMEMLARFAKRELVGS